jgi:hypothetical protein
VKKLLLFSLVAIGLFARENPFSEYQGRKVAPATVENRYDYLSKEGIALPNNTKVIKKISVISINDSGAEEVTEKNIDKYINSGGISIDQDPSIIRKNDSQIDIKTEGKKINLLTKDRKVSEFIIQNPTRVIVEFEKNGDELIEKNLEFFDSTILEKVSVIPKNDKYQVVLYTKNIKDAFITSMRDGYSVVLK